MFDSDKVEIPDMKSSRTKTTKRLRALKTRRESSVNWLITSVVGMAWQKSTSTDRRHFSVVNRRDAFSRVV